MESGRQPYIGGLSSVLHSSWLGFGSDKKDCPLERAFEVCQALGRVAYTHMRARTHAQPHDWIGCPSDCGSRQLASSGWLTGWLSGWQAFCSPGRPNRSIRMFLAHNGRRWPVTNGKPIVSPLAVLPVRPSCNLASSSGAARCTPDPLPRVA